MRYRRYYPRYHADGSFTLISTGWWFLAMRILFWPLMFCLAGAVVLALVEGNFEGAGFLFLLFALCLPGTIRHRR